MKYINVLMLIAFITTSAAAENLKFKRGNLENRDMHIDCQMLAIKAKLTEERIQLHADNAAYYMFKYWTKDIQQEVSEDLESVFVSDTRYKQGFVDGLILALKVDGEGVNQMYLKTCQSETLAFVEPKLLKDVLDNK